MRGVAINNRDAFVDKAMSKHDLLARNFVAPIGAPVDRCDEDIARLLMLSHLTCDSRSGRFREIVDKIDSRGNIRGAPLMRNAAGCRSKFEEKHSSVLCPIEHRWNRCFVRILSLSRMRNPCRI